MKNIKQEVYFDECKFLSIHKCDEVKTKGIEIQNTFVAINTWRGYILKINACKECMQACNN